MIWTRSGSHYRPDQYLAVDFVERPVVDARQKVPGPAIARPHLAPYHLGSFRGVTLMAVPASNKILTYVVVASGALLIAAAPPPAVAPDAAAVCVPPADAALPAAAGASAADPAQQVLIQYLSRRFLVASTVTGRMVAAAHRSADEVGLDPLLVLAVIAVESRFNPIAESGMGAKG